MKKTKLRDSARGEHCQLQLIPWCDWLSESVVLAHLPSPAKGMGIKSPDWFAVYACHSCHDIIDGRKQVDIDPVELERLKMRALFCTWERMIQEGLIEICK